MNESREQCANCGASMIACFGMKWKCEYCGAMIKYVVEDDMDLLTGVVSPKLVSRKWEGEEPEAYREVVNPHAHDLAEITPRKRTRKD